MASFNRPACMKTLVTLQLMLLFLRLDLTKEVSFVNNIATTKGGTHAAAQKSDMLGIWPSWPSRDMSGCPRRGSTRRGSRDLQDSLPEMLDLRVSRCC